MNINQNALDTTVKSNGMEKTTYYYAAEVSHPSIIRE